MSFGKTKVFGAFLYQLPAASARLRQSGNSQPKSPAPHKLALESSWLTSTKLKPATEKRMKLRLVRRLGHCHKYAPFKWYSFA
jgi:hypothetical protein